MELPPPNRKHIVTKSQYVQAQGKRIGITSMGCGLLTLALLCTLITVLCIYLSLFAGLSGLEIPVGLFFGGLAFLSGKLGFESFRRADATDPGVPLTRSVAETLPVEESLVRASEEPIQEQQALLLRAASDQQTPPEQLVRPSHKTEP
jgi:hypothetical protein